MQASGRPLRVLRVKICNKEYSKHYVAKIQTESVKKQLGYITLKCFDVTHERL